MSKPFVSYSNLQICVVSRYVYQYLDHLGNVRLSYSDLDKSGDIDKESEIIEENNYYPFGLKHRGYNEIVNAEREHKWRYSNKEFEDDFELNLYDSKARMYDQATGRFASIDPHASRYASHSTYNYAFSNPVLFGDPTGKDNMIYLIVAGDFSRKTAQAIVDKVNYYFENVLGVERRATLFSGDSFDKKYLDSNDNWAVIGNNRNAIIDKARGIDNNFVDGHLEGRPAPWSKDRSVLEEANRPNNGGNGSVIDYSTIKQTVDVYESFPASYEETSALVVIHADGHNVARFGKTLVDEDDYYGHEQMGALMQDGNSSTDGLLNTVKYRGMSSVLSPEKNKAYLIGLDGRYQNNEAQDNYYKNKMNFLRVKPFSSFLKGGRLIYKGAKYLLRDRTRYLFPFR